MACEIGRPEPVAVFCKLSDKCDQGVVDLAREAVSACIANLLNLPVPIPYLVRLPSLLANSVQSGRIAGRLRASARAKSRIVLISNE